MKILILFLTLVCAPVLAQLYIEKQDTEIVNLLKNPGLESGLGQWTYTSGTVTTSSTEAIQGSASALFQPTGVSQTLSSKLYFSSGLNGQKCEASLMYTTTEGTNPYIFRVVDSSSTVLASSILVSSTARAKQSLYFNCGANPIQTQLVATVSSPTFIKSDAFHLGSRRLTNKDVEDALGYVPLQSPIDINTNTTGSLAQNRLADSGVVSGTYTKVQVTSAGTVTSGTTLINSDLPDSGIASGTYTKIQINTKGIATSGTTLVESDIPNLQTTKITSGVFTVPFGGTGVSSVTTGSLWVGSGTSAVKNLPIGSTNQVLTVIGGTAAWAAPSTSAVSSPTIQNFQTAGTFTYTAPADLKYIQVTTIGGGGGGGNSGVSASTGGGAAGGISISILTAAQIGVSQSLTVGAGGSPNNTGGTTSFGSFLSATGGTQGSNSTGGIGGIGGIGSSGTVMIGVGGPGYTGTTYAGVGNFGGEGGSNAYGGGGRSVNGTIGNNGRGCGGGGSGHGDPNTAGSGSAGCVNILEYY